MTLRFETIPASPGKDPRYNGIDGLKLYDDESWVGTVWQSVHGFHWIRLFPQRNGVVERGRGGDVGSLSEGQLALVREYRLTSSTDISRSRQA